MTEMYSRGHFLRNGRWADIRKKAEASADPGRGRYAGGYERECALCQKLPTEDGFDSCLGELDDVVAACCGHGEPNQAYVLFADGHKLRADTALRLFMKLGIGPLT